MMLGLFDAERDEIALRRLRRLYDFATTFLTWGSQVSLESKVTPRKTASCTVATGSPNNLIVGLVGPFWFFLLMTRAFCKQQELGFDRAKCHMPFSAPCFNLDNAILNHTFGFAH